MEIFRSSQAATGTWTRSAIAIGNFDGVHLGHRALFDRARAMAKVIDGTAVALTFDPHPARFFRPKLAPPLISRESQKMELITDCGIDGTVIEPFDEALALMSPEDFAREILCKRLGAKHVIVGTEFVFGHNKSGNLASLNQLGEALGFVAHGIHPVQVESLTVSSSKIREFVLLGRVSGAADLLGSPFTVRGEVVVGEGRGRTIGVPTANVAPENDIIPGRGVYAGHTILKNGESYLAVINVGTSPTFNKTDRLTIEAHLLDYDGHLVGQTIDVAFAKRLRREKRFASADELVKAIRNDIAVARDLLMGGR
jgi:riboflavin kinase / FMN adenylyltransferase